MSIVSQAMAMPVMTLMIMCVVTVRIGLGKHSRKSASGHRSECCSCVLYRASAAVRSGKCSADDLWLRYPVSALNGRQSKGHISFSVAVVVVGGMDILILRSTSYV